MPLGEKYFDVALEARIGTMPAGSTVHLYGVDTGSEPDPSDELTNTDYAEQGVDTWSTPDGGITEMDLDFGTATEDWPLARAWAIRDTDGDVWEWNKLAEPLVALEDASVAVTLYLRSA